LILSLLDEIIDKVSNRRCISFHTIDIILRLALETLIFLYCFTAR
jgi:hypothetical protein